MKISALAERAGVPIGTIKYYLREGLLPPGSQTSRTTAEYAESHVERIRLIRALTDVGGLGIAAVHRVVTVLEEPDPARSDVLATAHGALVGGSERPESPQVTGVGGGDEDVDETAAADRAERWASRRGWYVTAGDPLLERLDRVWRACCQAGIDVDESLLDEYADAVEAVARVDVASVPDAADGAVRRVVVGTVMTEPVLATLRLIAQRQVAIRGPEEVA